MGHLTGVFSRITGDHKRLKTVVFWLVALSTLGISLTFFGVSLGRPYMGISIVLDRQGWRVESVDVNGLAGRAGIATGDKPVEINGQPADRFLQKYQGSGIVLGRLMKELTVVDEHGQLKSAVLKASSPSWEALLDQIARLLTTLVFLIIAFYVLLKKPKNIAARLLCLSGLDFSLVISGNMAASIAVPAADELQIIASVIGPWLLLHFLLILPDERIRLRASPFVYFIYLVPAITLGFFPFSGYADGQPVQWFRTVRLFGYALGFLAVVTVAILNYLYPISFKTRQQMKIVAIGFVAALLPFLMLYIIPEAIWRQSILPAEFSVLFFVFIPLGMGYAVVTRRLMDIDVIIRRGMVYGLLTTIMAAILAAGIFSAMAFWKSLSIPQEAALAVMLGGVTTALFGPMKRGVETLIDKLIYRDRYDYRLIIQNLSMSLNVAKEFVDVSRLIVGTTVQTLNLAGGCLVVKTPESASFEVSAAQGTFVDVAKQKQLMELILKRSSSIEFPNQAATIDPDVAFMIPLADRGKEISILFLSQKMSRQDFSPDDVYLLQGVAYVAEIALRNSILLHEVSARDTFVSIVSHELRTPLTLILGYGEFLLSHWPPDNKQRGWVVNIIESGHRMAAMVDELLDVTRMQSGRVNVKLETVRLTEVLDEHLAIARETTNKHEIVANVEPEIPDLIADRDKLGQVVANLLSNAIKYSPEGGRITLSARRDPEGHRVVVSVADEGIGIPPEDRDLLFTTFHRIHRPETKGIKGSGLGLYIAKEWTERMGGNIWLESELGKGSTFFIAIPAQDSAGMG